MTPLHLISRVVLSVLGIQRIMKICILLIEILTGVHLPFQICISKATVKGKNKDLKLELYVIPLELKVLIYWFKQKCKTLKFSFDIILNRGGTLGVLFQYSKQNFFNCTSKTNSSIFLRVKINYKTYKCLEPYYFLELIH